MAGNRLRTTTTVLTAPRAEEGSVSEEQRADDARIPAQRGTRPVLSERDLILVRHLSRGGSVAEVAAALSVSRNTARTRIRRVEAKLAVPDRGKLAAAARGLGLA